MKNIIKKFLYNFSADAHRERKRKEMHDFFSQATDRYHLEILEREWERKNRFI